MEGRNFKREKRVADGPDESMLALPSLLPAAVYPRPCLPLIVIIRLRVSSVQFCFFDNTSHGTPLDSRFLTCSPSLRVFFEMCFSL